jgi:hypothetical protein
VRELVMLAPIVVLIVAVGVYPKPFLDRIEPAASRAVRHLSSCSVDPAVIASQRTAGSPTEPCVAEVSGEGLFSERSGTPAAARRSAGTPATGITEAP